MRSRRVVVVGAGLVGLATARALVLRDPELRLTLVEKEEAPARHQSGRNSGVLHSGLYYRPGSDKARLCRRGRALLIDRCRRESIPLEICGKVVVAVEDSDLAALDELERRAGTNGVAARRIGAEELAEREPHVRGRAALLVPEAGIVDFRALARSLALELERGGAEIRTGARVLGLRRVVSSASRPPSIVVETTAGRLEAELLVNAAGLHADRVARLAGLDPPVRIVPFRGDYRLLRPERRRLCRHLVYPVPDPRFPFLGVHLTRRTDGSVECGPSAVLAFSREGYRARDLSIRDLAETLAWPGFRRLAVAAGPRGAAELLRALSRSRFLGSARRLVPELRPDDLLPAPSGVRAQAVDRSGRLVDDFLLMRERGAVHVLNAPSPAATSCLAIGERIADLLLDGRSD